MNTEPKVSLTIKLEGSVYKVVGKKVLRGELTAADLFPKQFPTPKMKNSKGGKRVIKKFTYTIKERVPVYASKHLNIGKDAYNYMISNEVPSWFEPYMKKERRFRDWKSMSQTERLEQHLQLISDDNHGISFTYSILED